jgi:hypothetical protein
MQAILQVKNCTRGPDVSIASAAVIAIPFRRSFSKISRKMSEPEALQGTIKDNSKRASAVQSRPTISVKRDKR